VQIILIAVICSVLLSLVATTVALTLVGKPAREEWPSVGPEAPAKAADAAPTPPEAGVEDLRAALTRGVEERARLTQAVTQNAREIAELKQLIKQGLARSGDVAVIDPVQQKQDALKRFAAIRQGERQLAIHQAVQDLTNLGDAVVPDIVALLESGARQVYGRGFSIGGGAVKSYQSSRMALIDVLRQIGTPAAKQGLLKVIASSDSMTDYRDLFLLYGGTRDEHMVKGMSALVPGLLRKLNEEGADELDRNMIERNLAAWIRQHDMSETVPDLVALVEKSATDHRGGSDYLGALVELDPDQASMVAQRLAATEDGTDAVRRLVTSHSLRSARLSKLARFYEQLFAGVPLPAKTRTTIYMLMPTKLCREIKSSTAQVADARRLLTFLTAQLGVERDEHALRFLKRSVEQLKREIERAERP